MDWYLKVWKKYAVFDGRARRQEYWYFVLFNTIFWLLLFCVDRLTGTYHSSRYFHVGLLSGLYGLAVLVPNIAVGVRRLHDTNRSGWWLLIDLVPVVGPVVLLVFLVLDSQAGENRYGPNPKLAADSGSAANQS